MELPDAPRACYGLVAPKVCTICAIVIYEIGTIVLLIAQDFSFTPS